RAAGFALRVTLERPSTRSISRTAVCVYLTTSPHLLKFKAGTLGGRTYRPMKTIIRHVPPCVALGILALAIVGCAGDRQVTVLKPVGPAVSVTRGHPTGYLIVNTAVEQ